MTTDHMDKSNVFELFRRFKNLSQTAELLARQAERMVERAKTAEKSAEAVNQRVEAFVLTMQEDK